MSEYFVNIKLQQSSHSLQKYLYTATNGFKMDTKGLADFVAKVMEDNGWTARSVADAARSGIVHSTVNKLRNGEIADPGFETLRALARGLKIPEDIIFSVARGVPITGEQFSHSSIAMIDVMYGQIDNEHDRRIADALIAMVLRELHSMEPETPPVPARVKGGGKIMTLDDARRDNEQKKGIANKK